MQSKTSFFNWTIFRKNITRYWPLWVGYVAVLMVALPVQLMGNLKYAPAEMRAGEADAIIYNTVRGLPMLVISLMVGVLAAISLWGYLYNHRSTSAFSSLPLRREGLFVTNIASGIFMILVCHVIVFLVTAAVEISYDVLNLTLLLQWLGMVSMNCIFFFGFATLCAMLTGLTIVLPVVYLVLNFTAFVVSGIINYSLEKLVYGYIGTIPEFVEWLTPVGKMAAQYGPEFALDGTLIGLAGWQACFGYFAVGIACIIAALLIYRKRRMESSGDVVAVLQLRPLFRCCMGFGTALVVGNILFGIVDNGRPVLNGGTVDAVKMCGFMIIGAFIGWFASDMMIKKTLKVFKKGWLGFAVISIIITGLLFSAEFDVFGYENKLPDVSEVEQVIIDQVASENPELIKQGVELHKEIIGAKDIYKLDWDDAIQGNIGVKYFYVNYQMKNGETLSRAYMLPYDYGKRDEEQPELLKSMNDFLTSPLVISESLAAFNQAEEAQYDYATISFSTVSGIWMDIQVTPAEMYDLYNNCIYPDIMDGFMTVGGFLNNGYSDQYECYINITIRENLRELRDRYQEITLKPTPESKRTNAWLEEHGVELVQYKDIATNEQSVSAGQIYIG